MKIQRAYISAIGLSYVLIATSAQAQIAQSLADLVQTPGSFIIADDKRFSNFQIASITTTGGGIVNPALIAVTPLADNPLNPGLKFTAPTGALGTPFSHAGPASALLTFSFDVQTTNNLPLIKDNSLLVNDWIFDSGPNALIRISEEVLGVTGAPLGFKQVVVSPGDVAGDPDHFDTANFSPTNFLHIIKRIEILGPGTNDGAFLRMFEQRFSQVPEPGSFTLVVTCAVCWILRRRPRKPSRG